MIYVLPVRHYVLYFLMFELLVHLRLILSASVRIGNECRTTRGHSTTDIGYPAPLCVCRTFSWRGDTQLVHAAAGGPRAHAERRLVTAEERAANLGDSSHHHLGAELRVSGCELNMDASVCSAHEHRRRKAPHVGGTRSAEWRALGAAMTARGLGHAGSPS